MLLLVPAYPMPPKGQAGPRPLPAHPNRFRHALFVLRLLCSAQFVGLGEEQANCNFVVARGELFSTGQDKGT